MGGPPVEAGSSFDALVSCALTKVPLAMDDVAP